MADQLGTIGVVTVELGRLLRPLADAAERAGKGDTDAIPNFLKDVGIYDELNEDQVRIIEETVDVVDAWKRLNSSVMTPVSKGNTPGPGEIQTGIEAAVEIFESVDDLGDVRVEALDDPSGLGDVLLDYLIVRYLRNHRRGAYGLLSLAGVVVDPPDDEALARVNPSALADALADAGSIPERVFDWGDAGFKAYAIVHAVSALLDSITDHAVLTDGNVFDLDPDQAKNPALNHHLRANVDEAVKDTASIDLTGVLAPVPDDEANDKLPGLAVLAMGSGTFDDTYQVGGDWELSIESSGSVDRTGAAAQPKENGSVDVEYGKLHRDHTSSGEIADESKTGGKVELTAELTYTGGGAGPGGSQLVFGTRGGSGLTLGEASLEVYLEASSQGTEFRVEVPLGATLTVDPEGGILEKLVPRPITADFELTPGYSTEKGVYFAGSADLSVPIRLNQELGPISVSEVYVELGIDPETGQFQPTVALSADGSLGPIGASIKRSGVGGSLAFPETRDGNLGLADLGVEFEPPSGIGLSLDTGPISGGGSLGFDPDNGRYSGTFGVSIGPVDVRMMGLLTPELPSSSDGYSLLLSIFGGFPPVQLGMGFTMNGLGGMVGVNRALKADPLLRATKSGNLDSVLFPDDPAAHAQRIVSDLRSIYPPTVGQHVFGPMARFGWGTPSLVLMDLGIVLQLPAAKVALLGDISIGLPTAEAPEKTQIVRMNLAATGILDPERQLFALDAALYDSRVLLWTIKGGMAMRVGWGDNPQFVLAVGGFNPRFEPPENFPKVKRVTVCLDIPGGTPSVEWKGYFAVTANTVQVGAAFDARFEAGPVGAHAWWGLDALFQFNPFKFVVDFEAGVEVWVFGLEMSISLNGTIKGPSPVHIQGQLHIGTPWPLPDPKPHVSITIGEEKEKRESLPTANVLPKFGAELAKPDNWSAQLPTDGTSVVSLREIEPGDGVVLAHPMGRLSVRQTLVPIGRSIERFGDNKPKHVSFDFNVDMSGIDLPPVGRELKEEFAPEQYLKMSDSEKMNAPTFRRWTAGRAVAGDLFDWGCTYRSEGPDGTWTAERRAGNATTARMEYEHTQLDTEVESDFDEKLDARGGRRTSADGGNDRPKEYPVEVARALADNGAVAKADSRREGSETFEPDGDERITIDSNYGQNIDRIGVEYPEDLENRVAGRNVGGDGQ